MRNVLGFLVGLLLALVCGVAMGADSTCTEFRARYTGGGGPISGAWFSGASQADVGLQACSSLADAMVGLSLFIGGMSRHVVSHSGVGYTAGSPSFCTGTFNWEPGPYSTSGFGTHNFQSQNVGTALCPSADPCTDTLAIADPVVVMGATSVGGELCGSDDGTGGAFAGGLYGKGCAVVKRGAGISSAGGHWYGQVSYTGVSCGASASPVNTASTANCVASGGGSVCVSRTDAGAVRVGGETVDVRDVPEDSCSLLSGGGALCDSGATEVPKDSGGTPLDPTLALTATGEPTGTTEGASSTVNYYSSVVVSESYSIVTGSSSSGLDGSGEGGSGSVDDLEGGDMEEAGTFVESAGGFWDRVQGSALVSAVAGISGSLSGGTCPAWNETVEAGAFGTYELDFSFICVMWEDIAPVISAVMLACFAFAALRILMSA